MDVPKKPSVAWWKDKRKIGFASVLAALSLTGLIFQVVTIHGSPSQRELRVDAKTEDFTIEAIGTVEPTAVFVVAAEVDGSLEAIRVDVGDNISRGEIIATLKNPEAVSRLRSASYSLRRANAQYLAAKANADARLIDDEALLIRSREALGLVESEHAAKQASFEKGVISRLALDEVASRLRVATADLQASERRVRASLRLREASMAVEEEARTSADEDLKSAQDAVAKLEVRSPIDGILRSLKLQRGESVTDGQEIARVLGSGDVVARLRVPEDIAQYIVVDASAKIQVGNQDVSGQVTRISPVVEDGSRQVDVRLDPSEVTPMRFADQTTAQANLLARIPNNLASLPHDKALIPGKRLELTVIDESGVAEIRNIQLGQRLGDRVLIRSGAKPGEVVLVDESTEGVRR